MNDQSTAPLREDTMLYRAPTADSDESKVSEIWGKTVETRVVDASEVADLLAAGWVQNPLDLDKRPEERGGFEKVAGKELEQTRLALDTAEKLVEELEKRIDDLSRSNVAIQAERDKALADNDKIAGDLKAAEELADAETKAKEAALARVAELEAAATPPPKKG